MDAVLVPARNPGEYTGSGNNTYVVLGSEPAIIDAGVGVPAHLEDVAYVLDGAPLHRVLVTHGHQDHAAGVPALLGRWSDAVPLKLPWPDVDALSGVGWSALRDAEDVPAGDAVLRVVHTPGHSPDHVCFLHEESGILFGGDLLVAGGTVVIPASKGGSLVEYLESLRRVLDLAPRRVLPAHGPAIEEPERLILEYLAHRSERERQIVEALESGRPVTLEEIVRSVYIGLPASLRSAAAETVGAHLVKLEAEGQVVRDGGAWRRT